MPLWRAVAASDMITDGTPDRIKMVERLTLPPRADLTAFSVDRDLPVPLGTQLRGLIEFGIGLGTLRAGERLPSVRELADHLGVAPMTVAQVYGEMKAAGVIVSRTGSGTFVADLAPVERQPARHDLGLHRAVDTMIAHGRALGLRASDLAGLIAARMGDPEPTDTRPVVAVVGHFAQTTAAYCTEMAQAVDDAALFKPTTLAMIEQDADARRWASLADLVITFPHRRSDVTALLPEQVVTTMTFIPAVATRQALAALEPSTRIGIVSIFPEFAPLMKAGVQRFAPHVADVSVALHETPELAPMLRRVDVVVYATGADNLGLAVPDGVASFEYRHTPDPACVRRLIRPLLQAKASFDQDG